jgi:quercetin dioxygenase-like cupin family protein
MIYQNSAMAYIGIACRERHLSSKEIVMTQVVKVGQLEIRYLVDGAKQGGLGLFEMEVPAGARVPPPHSHTHNEECVYVLEGVLRYTVDGETRDLKPGEWMSTPRGAVHEFSNPGTVTARTLVVMTPDIGEQYFHDVAAVVAGGGPPDRAKLVEVMARYGLVPAAPQSGGRTAPDRAVA